MKNTLKNAIVLGLAIGLPAIATAGPASPLAEAPASNPGDWCSWLQSKPGTIYKNAENPFLQSFNIGARFQYQTAYVDGQDVNGRDFTDTYDDYRRVRIETKTEFLRYFTAKIGINAVSDNRNNPAGGGLDWPYEDFDEAYVNFNIKKAFGVDAFDTLDVQYGRHKFNMTEEVHMSSKEIYTIERSAIANKLYGSPNRATGLTLNGSVGAWSATLGIFSGEDDSEFIGGWNDGQAYYFSGAYQHSEELRFVLDFVQNDQSGADDYLGYDWATALNAIYDDGRFGTLATLVVGENNGLNPARGGSFHGLVVMPWYWIMEDKLQAVFQYQYAGSQRDQGIRTNSRYVRSQHDNPLVNDGGGRGDELHTLYAGLNYLICGDNAKIMAGIEYSTLNTPAGDMDAFTYSLAFRTYF
ncbi:hypothetical protein HZ994_08890 [Akkermansiaceae bacterium]|nr:hypothetical protein HZ994_08890 [Akkermansiaceae bacterium]